MEYPTEYRVMAYYADPTIRPSAIVWMRTTHLDIARKEAADLHASNPERFRRILIEDRHGSIYV